MVALGFALSNGGAQDWRNMPSERLSPPRACDRRTLHERVAFLAPGNQLPCFSQSPLMLLLQIGLCERRSLRAATNRDFTRSRATFPTTSLATVPR